MRRDLNTCSSQSPMHHGIPVRVFFRRSSEHHSRNDSSSSTSRSYDSRVFSHSRTLVVPGTFLRVLYNIHHHVAFARELEEKKTHTPSRTNQQYAVQYQQQQQQQQRQPQQKQAAATATTPAAAVEKQKQQKMPKARANIYVCTPYAAVRDFSV